MTKWKERAINLFFSIILFVLVVGHIGLGLFSAHWFSLLRSEFWVSFGYPLWKPLALTLAILLASVIFLCVLSIAYNFSRIFASISCIVMIIVFAIVGILLSQLSSSTINHIKSSAVGVLSNNTRFSLINKCNWTSTNNSCEAHANKFISIRFDTTKKWYIFYTVCWLSAAVFLAPMLKGFCKEKAD